MPRRLQNVAASILVVGVVALAACGASVDTVKDAADTSSTTVGDTTSVTGGDAPTTTAKADKPKDDKPKSDGKAGPYVDAMVDSMLADDDFPATEKQARCFAANSVDVIGVDRLQAKGITPDDLRSDSSMDLSDIGLSMDEGNDIYDGFEDCGIDVKGLMLESMEDDGKPVPDEVKTCIDTVLTKDNLRKLMVSSIVNGDDETESDPETKPIMNGLMGCLFMAMGSTSTTVP